MKEKRTELDRREGLAKLKAIIGIPICILVALIVTIMLIGNGAYVYDDATYEKIENAVRSCVKEEIGVDLIKLQSYVQKYNMQHDEEDNVLICQIKDGFFNAKITTQLTEQYKIVKMTKNYADFNQYMKVFWTVFAIGTIVGGVILWWIIIGLWYLIEFIIIKISTRRRNDKVYEERKEEETAQN